MLASDEHIVSVFQKSTCSSGQVYNVYSFIVDALHSSPNATPASRHFGEGDEPDFQPNLQCTVLRLYLSNCKQEAPSNKTSSSTAVTVLFYVPSPITVAIDWIGQPTTVLLSTFSNFAFHLRCCEL
ncbi:hypothetical protein OUZ56_003788 [Daphnia magna]|uniref:Uncharacterized protein n=1 Tax=Daphnia magna TaxID=35525 RepID=A0ABQ9YMT0_9CRUS|nr:hypothetical protein OUZ56_003788 [Daphnia magna]